MNAVQFDVLLLANKNMKYNKRSWYNYGRDFECEKLREWFKRDIKKDWLSDNRGILKQNKFVKAWQRGRFNENGAYAGSESRRQFAWVACLYLYSRGIMVCREAYAAAKRRWREPTKPKPIRKETSAGQEEARAAEKDKAWTDQKKAWKDREKTQVRSKENPFLDPEFRKRKGFKTPLPKGA